MHCTAHICILEREREREAAGSRDIVSYIQRFAMVLINHIILDSVDYAAHAHVGNICPNFCMHLKYSRGSSRSSVS